MFCFIFYFLSCSINYERRKKKEKEEKRAKKTKRSNYLIEDTYSTKEKQGSVDVKTWEYATGNSFLESEG